MYFGGALGLFLGYFGGTVEVLRMCLGVTLGVFLVYFGGTVGALRVYLGCVLGVLWGILGVICGTSGDLGTLVVLWEYLAL